MSLRSIVLAAIASLFALTATAAAPVRHDLASVKGVKTDRYLWTDSRGRPRAAFLKREGQGNPGHGGYAVRITYQVKEGAVWKTITADATPGNDGGFGYFVSHERYRDFTDGSNNTIGIKIFGTDDSPLGRNFAVTGTALNLGNPNAAAHRFKLTYPRYGTKSPIPKNAEGEDVSNSPTDPAKFQRYLLPVTLTWVFQNGKDFPRINVRVGLSNLPGPDRVNFDLRAPYGVLNFDNGGNNPIAAVMWGDRYHFINLKRPLTRNSTWRWTGANKGARYTALIAGVYEMGLFEPKTFATSKLVDGWTFGRGLTSSQYRCDEQNTALPCDWEWPYQSAQYSLPENNNNAPTTFEKIAWGTAPYWGTGSSMTRVYDTDDTSRPFNGFPGNKLISYDICVVLGRTTTAGLTKTVAAGSNYNCATVAAP